MRLGRALGTAIVLAGALTGSARAQDTVFVVRRGDQVSPPSSIERWAVDFFNAPATTRVIGDLTIDRNAVYDGDIAVFDGRLLIRGVVGGTVVAINADVEVDGGAVIDGDVIVLGGVLEDRPGADIGGSLRQQRRRVEARLVGERLELVRVAVVVRRQVRHYYGADGGASILLGLGDTYNRVEGLPLHAGAKIAWRDGPVRTELRGYGIFRTAGDFKREREDIGYYADARIDMGRRPRLTIGGRAYDVVRPTQSWPLTSHEAGWGALLWHRDYRDYFLQRGFAGFLEFAPMPPLVLSAEVARVDETSIAARDPWTPWRNDQLWRPNPLIDAGDYTIISAALEYDRRPERWSGWHGWFLRITWDRGLGEGVAGPVLPATIRSPLPTDSYVYDRASADLRWYQRIGWGGQFRVRGFWAGSVGEDPLPIQRRFSLGGPDPLMGYPFRAFACNAGAAGLTQVGLCDDVLLFQAEYRGRLDFDFFEDVFDKRVHPDPDEGLRPDPDEGLRFWDWGDGFWFDGPALVLFSNAGTGWLDGQDIGSLSFDVGAGVEFGSVGFYVAKALKEGEPVRVALRIERRF